MNSVLMRGYFEIIVFAEMLFWTTREILCKKNTDNITFSEVSTKKLNNSYLFFGL
jgi:hypothetical protein